MNELFPISTHSEILSKAAQIYDIYHDESKEDAYWHGFLMVPRENRDNLLMLLNQARINIGYHEEISYKHIRRRAKAHHHKPKLIESWCSIMLAALQQQKHNRLITSFHLGGKKYEKKYVRQLDTLLKCKFVVFREKDNHDKMYAHMDELKCIETTFRMGLKGGIHSLFNKDNPVTIGNIYIDGDEHYYGKYGRTLSTARILKQFGHQARDYVSFLEDSKIIAQRSNHKKIKKDQETQNSHLLQMCDIFLGGIRFFSYRPDSKHVKYKISYPCRILLEHDLANVARMSNSRFYNAFLLSAAHLIGDKWSFDYLKPSVDIRIRKERQLCMEYYN